VDEALRGAIIGVPHAHLEDAEFFSGSQEVLTDSYHWFNCKSGRGLDLDQMNPESTCGDPDSDWFKLLADAPFHKAREESFEADGAGFGSEGCS
jgi:hypothetical protein